MSDLPILEARVGPRLNNLGRWEYVTLALMALEEAGVRKNVRRKVRVLLEGSAVFGPDYGTRPGLTGCNHAVMCSGPCSLACSGCGRELELDPEQEPTPDLLIDPCPDCEEVIKAERAELSPTDREFIDPQ